MPLLTWKLWLARLAVRDHPLPWQKPQARLTPGRVRQSLGALFAQIGTPAQAPKPRGKSVGWPTGRPRTKAPRHKIVKQVDKEGKPYEMLHAPVDSNLKPPGPDSRIPTNLPVQPYDLSKYIAPDQKSGDLVHRFYQQQYQIDGGKMDKFVAWSDNGGLTLSYYDATQMPEGKLANSMSWQTTFSMQRSADRSSITFGSSARARRHGRTLRRPS
jgi:hypothetical protein